MSSPPHSPSCVYLVLPTVDPAGKKEPMAASQTGAGGGKKPASAPVRVWSEADEVRILEGLAAYTAIHGAPPGRSQLHGALEGRGLDKAEFTVTEIYEKVRRLRTKYGNLRAAGGPPVPAGGANDGAEGRKYELSTAIWGDQPLNASKKGGRRANAVPPEAGVSGTRVRRGFEELQGMYPSLAVEVERITNDEVLKPVLKMGFELIDDQEAGRLDYKVKRQMVREAQMMIDRTTLRNEVLKTLIRSMD